MQLGTFNFLGQAMRAAMLLVAALVLMCAPAARAQDGCSADVDGDGIVNGNDLASVLGGWGSCSGCGGDVNGNGVINGEDLAVVLTRWGSTCAPTVTGISPDAGPLAGGVVVTITGDRLLNPTGVTFGGTSATILSSTRTTVSVMAPARPAGGASIVVTTQGGAVNAGSFTYYGAPTITGVSPNAGAAAGGTTVSIAGTGFYGSPTVRFGKASAASVTVVSPSELLAVAPAGTAGSPVAVSVTTGSGTAVAAAAFNYIPLSVPSWATMLEAAPNPVVVTDAGLRNSIGATGFAWRVRDNATNIELVLIPPGAFDMGCSHTATLGCISPNELPVHPVSLSAPMYMGRFEVTQAQWVAVFGSNPSSFQGANYPDAAWRPVEDVGFDGLVSFTTATGLRLPTEAEWEYAYRAGTTTAFHSMPGFPNGTDDVNHVGTIAWILPESAGQTQPVGLKAANGFGLHDMAGNVEEFVADWYSETYYASSPTVDPQGPDAGAAKVLRGGSWGYNIYNRFYTASARSWRSPSDGGYYSSGFRVARSAVSAPPTVTAITPAFGSQGGGTTIEIVGANFTGGGSVLIGGVPATEFTVVSPTIIRAVTPPGTVGAKSVAVTTDGGTAVAPSQFFYQSSLVWATVLEQSANPTIVQNVALRNAISATGLPWRVRDNMTNIEMLLIPPGTFQMGCSTSNWPCAADETPTHAVTISAAFYIGRYEVTQAQWTARMGSNPSNYQSASAQVPAAQVPNRPVERVSWNMVQSFNLATGLRLPTEAEWEYAYRAGTTTTFHSTPAFPNGTNDFNQVGNIAWFGLNSVNQPRPVGQKVANGFGLHDMSGNVEEWVNDWYRPDYYASSPAADPRGPVPGFLRTVRGGSWYTGVYSGLRASVRGANHPSNPEVFPIRGFRVARNP